MKIKIKYFNNSIEKIKKINIGDWIDLRCIDAQIIKLKNTIKDTEWGIYLTRNSIKSPIVWEDGFIDNNKSVSKQVKFFRYKAGDFLLINLGIAMELPTGYEANIVPRSSTFKAITSIQTNSYGVIDESYKGDNDYWFMPALAMQDGFIIKNERICQFKITKKMPKIEFEEVEKLGNIDRKGFGSTGRN